jgi:Fe-S-cluster-containing dehydrogenase component
MGYVYATGTCIGCGNLFSFHPNKVPSLTYNGTRQPVCQGCVDRVNPMRKANGLPPIVPLPGAYEPADENDINWS